MALIADNTPPENARRSKLVARRILTLAWVALARLAPLTPLALLALLAHGSCAEPRTWQQLHSTNVPARVARAPSSIAESPAPLPMPSQINAGPPQTSGSVTACHWEEVERFPHAVRQEIAAGLRLRTLSEVAPPPARWPSAEEARRDIHWLGEHSGARLARIGAPEDHASEVRYWSRAFGWSDPVPVLHDTAAVERWRGTALRFELLTTEEFAPVRNFRCRVAPRAAELQAAELQCVEARSRAIDNRALHARALAWDVGGTRVSWVMQQGRSVSVEVDGALEICVGFDGVYCLVRPSPTDGWRRLHARCKSD